jgi:nucleotide-binding universal stress UspA family protein
MNGEVPSLERVLCALDVDASARGALSVGSVIAQRFRASFDALYAPAPVVAFAGRAERVRRLIAEHNARERMQGLLAPFESSLSVSSFITRGQPSEVILSHSEQRRSDLIVMGGSAKLRFGDGSGGIVAPVATAATCAVLTVGGRTAECAMRRILLPVGPTLAESPAVGWAIALGLRFGAEVHLLRVGAPRVGFWQAWAGPGRSPIDLPAERRARLRSDAVLVRLHAARVEARELKHSEHAHAAGIVALAGTGRFDLIIAGLHAQGDDTNAGEALVAALRRRTNASVLSVRAPGGGTSFARGGLARPTQWAANFAIPA